MGADSIIAGFELQVFETCMAYPLWAISASEESNNIWFVLLIVNLGAKVTP
jgi:hypothetical protein